MSEQTPKNPPMDIKELGDFIVQFTESTARLRESHDRLRSRADELAGELSEKNRELSARVEEVSALKNYLSNILGSISDGVLALDRQGRLSALNDSAEALFPLAIGGGLMLDEVKDHPCERLVKLLIEAMEKEVVHNNVEIRIKLPDGPVALSVSAGPIRDSAGEVQGAVATYRDNTELRRLEKQLIRQERLAALGEMASQLAHEIRNPLGGIELYASLLDRALADNPEEQKLAVKIGSATSSLNRLVEDMLTFARPSEPCLVDVKPGSIMDAALETALAGCAVDDGLGKIKIERNYDYEETFPLDPDLMQRAFLNVMINALQFMEDGGTLRLSSQKNVDGGLSLAISDTGPGIAPEIREQVFNPFFTRRENGTGLGLAIVNKITQDHGASVTVSQNDPHGAVFTFEFKKN